MSHICITLYKSLLYRPPTRRSLGPSGARRHVDVLIFESLPSLPLPVSLPQAQRYQSSEHALMPTETLAGPSKHALSLAIVQYLTSRRHSPKHRLVDCSSVAIPMRKGSAEARGAVRVIDLHTPYPLDYCDSPAFACSSSSNARQ